MGPPPWRRRRSRTRAAFETTDETRFSLLATKRMLQLLSRVIIENQKLILDRFRKHSRNLPQFTATFHGRTCVDLVDAAVLYRSVGNVFSRHYKYEYKAFYASYRSDRPRKLGNKSPNQVERVYISSSLKLHVETFSQQRMYLSVHTLTRKSHIDDHKVHSAHRVPWSIAESLSLASQLAYTAISIIE